MYKLFCIGVMYLFLAIDVEAESFRAMVAGELEISAENPEGSSLDLAYNGSVVLRLGREVRFFRGMEVELSAPQSWLAYPGSVAIQLYAELDRTPVSGANDLEGQRVAFDLLPNKIKMVYQIPFHSSHGLKSSPYAAILAGVVPPASFPILFRLMPVIKGISEDLEIMRFVLVARPILSDEGAVMLNFRYPEQLKGKPFVALIDDVVVSNTDEELLLREGEHHLVILSDDYRNESRRFIVERTKRLDMVIELQDPTPLVIFEAPENAQIFLNNVPVLRETGSIPVEPGTHEVRFQVGDYTVIKTVTVQRGKTYRVALSVGVDIEENE